MIVADVEFVLRSLDSSWSYARWEKLPADGNRYEVIDGALYMTTAPSFFHQWIVQRLVRFVGLPAEDAQIAFCATAPVGVLMPGCDPVQPDFLLIRAANASIITGDWLHLRHFDLQIDAAPQRRLKLGRNPRALVQLLQHQLRAAVIQVGEARLVTLERQRKPQQLGVERQ
jgi:hypothetical protein